MVFLALVFLPDGIPHFGVGLGEKVGGEHFLPAGKGPDFNSGQPQAGRRLKSVELIVESTAWRPRHARRHDDEIVAVRIAYQETELRQRAKPLGALWRPAQKLWEIAWRDVKRLGIIDRVVQPDA